MNTASIFKVFIFVASCCFLTTPLMANQGRQDVCDPFTEQAKRICNAYCHAMDCSNQASKKFDSASCQHKKEQWQSINPGVNLPCEQSNVTLTKEIFDNTGGDGVNIPAAGQNSFVFVITNIGSSALTNITLSDNPPLLTGVLICNPFAPFPLNSPTIPSACCTKDIQTGLQVGEEVRCFIGNYSFDVLGPHTDTATVTATVADTGATVMASDTVSVNIVLPPTMCPGDLFVLPGFRGIDYGSVGLGQSANGTFTVYNLSSCGGIPINSISIVDDPQFPGGDAGNFSIVGTTCPAPLPNNLPLGGSCEIVVSFMPTSIGVKNAILEIKYFHPFGNVTMNLFLTGTGI